AQAARRHVGADAARLIRHFGAGRVAVVRLHLAVVHQAVQLHAVYLHGRVGLARPVDAHVDLFHLLVAADVGVRHADARHECGQAGVVPGRWEGVEQIAAEDVRSLRALHVNGRRRAGDRDRFLEGADPQLGVDRRREVGRQFDAFAPECVEALQREDYVVGPGPEVDDAVATFAVGDDTADL